jgi:lysine 2,3-aminomutase
MKTYPGVAYHEVALFKNVSEKDWNDWKWQVRNVIRDIETLKKVIPILEPAGLTRRKHRE